MGQRVVLKLAARSTPDLELWILRKEKRYFREVFSRNLAGEHN